MKKWINEDGKVVFNISKDFDKFVKKHKKLLMKLSRE
jgi:hypothetical protein